MAVSLSTELKDCVIYTTTELLNIGPCSPLILIELLTTLTGCPYEYESLIKREVRIMIENGIIVLDKNLKYELRGTK